MASIIRRGANRMMWFIVPRLIYLRYGGRVHYRTELYQNGEQIGWYYIAPCKDGSVGHYKHIWNDQTNDFDIVYESGGGYADKVEHIFRSLREIRSKLLG